MYAQFLSVSLEDKNHFENLRTSTFIKYIYVKVKGKVVPLLN
jgi:hypothetical protein